MTELHQETGMEDHGVIAEVNADMMSKPMPAEKVAETVAEMQQRLDAMKSTRPENDVEIQSLQNQIEALRHIN